jgi:hypothetical protein
VTQQDKVAELRMTDYPMNEPSTNTVQGALAFTSRNFTLLGLLYSSRREKGLAALD